MSGLTHYLVVRRDLPVGVLCAQLAHAAGESFHRLPRHLPDHLCVSCGRVLLGDWPADDLRRAFVTGASWWEVVSRGATMWASDVDKASAEAEKRYDPPCRGSSEKERAVPNRDVAGSSPAPGSTFDPSRTTVVILGARNAGKLARLELQLVTAGVPHVSVREPDSPWCGALMAIGLVPGDRDALSPLLNEFQLLRSVDGDL